jgi:ribonuclease BN (tRNA processing enzyme)
MSLAPNRREFLRTAGAALVGVSAIGPEGAGQGRGGANGTRLVLLGTGGGPRPRKDSAATSHAIVIGDQVYVVDCGDGVARQLVAAGLSLRNLRHVFITHHHSDHNADYGNLLLLAWAVGLSTRVDTWGPPPLDRMTRQFFEMNAFDIDTRIADEGRSPLTPLVHPHDLTSDGVVLKDDRVTVRAVHVNHPPIEHAYAFRFDTANRSIVISGDTNRSDALIRLAGGADVLVHEALWVPAVDRLVQRVPNASSLKKHIIDSHTSAEECGRIAAAAGVHTLVLSHLVPADDPLVTEQMWLDAAQTSFKGRVIVAKDLLEI